MLTQEVIELERPIAFRFWGGWARLLQGTTSLPQVEPMGWYPDLRAVPLAKILLQDSYEVVMGMVTLVRGYFRVYGTDG